jgi:hypothetical protein
MFPHSIINFFSSQNLYKPNDQGQKRFIEDVVLFITKGYMLLSYVENPWLHRLIMR